MRNPMVFVKDENDPAFQEHMIRRAQEAKDPANRLPLKALKARLRKYKPPITLELAIIQGLQIPRNKRAIAILHDKGLSRRQAKLLGCELPAFRHWLHSLPNRIKLCGGRAAHDDVMREVALGCGNEIGIRERIIEDGFPAPFERISWTTASDYFEAEREATKKFEHVNQQIIDFLEALDAGYGTNLRPTGYLRNQPQTRTTYEFVST